MGLDALQMLKKNISTMGRLIRLALGLVLLAAVWIVHSKTGYISFGLTLVGLFCLFQAVMGWCAARACGIQTKF